MLSFTSSTTRSKDGKVEWSLLWSAGDKNKLKSFCNTIPTIYGGTHENAFKNAITTVLALGGSTNAVLHLLAIAHESKINLNIEVFDNLSKSVPHLADMKPFGKYHMVDLDKIGGVPVVSKILLENNLIDPDCLTVTGKTVGENLEDVEVPKNQDVIYFPENPISNEGGI